MKKIFLRIESFNLKTGDLKNTDLFLLTDNICACLGSAGEGLTRMYFKNAIPFSYITIYLEPVQFDIMIKGLNKFEIKRETTLFKYSITEI